MTFLREKYKQVVLELGDLLIEQGQLTKHQSMKELYSMPTDEKLEIYSKTIELLLNDEKLMFNVTSTLKKTNEKVYQRVTDLILLYGDLSSVYHNGTNFMISKKNIDGYLQNAQDTFHKLKPIDFTLDCVSVNFEGEPLLIIFKPFEEYCEFSLIEEGEEEGLHRKIDLVITIDKLPRIFIDCGKFKECPYFLPIQKVGRKRCMKTPRTCQNCGLFLKKTNGDRFTMAHVGLQLTKLLFDVVEKYQRQPKVINKHRERFNQRHSISVENDYIVVNKTNYRYVESGTGRGTGSGGYTVCEHERQGHYRHYKSGKKVWIDSIKVNQGKGEKKVYKL